MGKYLPVFVTVILAFAGCSTSSTSDDAAAEEEADADEGANLGNAVANTFGGSESDQAAMHVRDGSTICDIECPGEITCDPTNADLAAGFYGSSSQGVDHPGGACDADDPELAWVHWSISDSMEMCGETFTGEGIVGENAVHGAFTVGTTVYNCSIVNFDEPGNATFDCERADGTPADQNAPSEECEGGPDDGVDEGPEVSDEGIPQDCIDDGLTEEECLERHSS